MYRYLSPPPPPDPGLEPTYGLLLAEDVELPQTPESQEIEDLKALYEELRSRPARPISITGNGASALMLSKSGLIVGWHIREQSGAAMASFSIFSGGGTGGVLVACANLASAGADNCDCGDEGPLCESGVYFNLDSGAVRGAVWIKF